MVDLSGAVVVASVSGGKDSAALSLWLTEQGIEHRRVFADTGWEAPETYDYLRGDLPRAIGEIEWLTGLAPMADLVRRKAMFPSRVRRFCTEELKVKPIFGYLLALVADGVHVVNAVGIRAAESEARSKLMEWDGYRDKRGAFDIWRPLLDWTEADVIAIHKRHGLRPNPLYLAGASRVGCWPCIFARKAEIALVAKRTPERIDELRALEAEVTSAADARAAKKGATNRLPRTFFAGRGGGKRGRAGAILINDAVAWATGHGQEELIETAPDVGCVRWGMCEPVDGGA